MLAMYHHGIQAIDLTQRGQAQGTVVQVQLPTRQRMITFARLQQACRNEQYRALAALPAISRAPSAPPKMVGFMLGYRVIHRCH